MFHYIRLYLSNNDVLSVEEISNGMKIGLTSVFHAENRSTLDDYAKAFRYACDLATAMAIPLAIDPEVILWRER
jgi:hypothetical protein